MYAWAPMIPQSLTRPLLVTLSSASEHRHCGYDSAPVPSLSSSHVISFGWFEAFGSADDFYEIGSEAKPDAMTTLLSLPVELLLEITRCSRFSDIYSFTTVNKNLPIKRFHSLVTINATKFLSDLATSPGIKVARRFLT